MHVNTNDVGPANMAHSKLSVIGAGAVGSSIAYASLIRGSARQIALYDIDQTRVEAEVRDLAHGTQFTPTEWVMGGSDMSVLKDSSVIVITAGARQKPGQSRMDLAAQNASIMAKLVPQMLEQAPDAVLVMVTNPCDVLTVVAQQVSGLPVGRVLSTGTLLDTSRLRWAIARRAGVSLSNVHAAMMGEHGDTEFALWSSATIAQIPIRDWTNPDGERVFSEQSLAQIAYDTVHAAYSIIEGKGATNYAIGLAGTRIIQAVLRDEHLVLPVSSMLHNWHGISGVCMSVPQIVGREGVIKPLELPVSAQELVGLQNSADHIRTVAASLGF